MKLTGYVFDRRHFLSYIETSRETRRESARESNERRRKGKKHNGKRKTVFYFICLFSLYSLFSLQYTHRVSFIVVWNAFEEIFCVYANAKGHCARRILLFLYSFSLCVFGYTCICVMSVKYYVNLVWIININIYS